MLLHDCKKCKCIPWKSWHFLSIFLHFQHFLLRFLISLITSTFPAGLKEKELPLYAFYAFCFAAILGCLLYFITDFNVGHHLRLRSMLFDSGIWSEDAVFEEYSLQMLPTSFWRLTMLLMCFKVIEKADFVLSEKEVL